MKLDKQNNETPINESSERARLSSSSVMHPFFSDFQSKIEKALKSNFKRLRRDGDALMSSIVGKKGASVILDVDLEKQMQPWKENPTWTDHPPEIKVTVPKGSLCNLNVKVNVGLPPDAVYNIVTDPENKRVFKNIQKVISRKVLLDEGPRQVVELEQAAMWKFLWWSGTISVHVLVDQNREDHSSWRLGVLLLAGHLAGVITEDVVQLRKSIGAPGMAVLQFGFGSDAENPHLPHNHECNQVVYTGTHDNDTIQGWWDGLPQEEKSNVLKYLPSIDEREISWGLIQAALSSVAQTTIIPMQDILGLGTSARMNIPATQFGNWSWRIPHSISFDSLGNEAKKLRDMLGTYGRL